MFLVLTKYIKGMEEVDKFLPAHSVFLDGYYDRKKIIFSGRRNPRVGGAILFKVDTEEEVKAILAEDPFRINGITECEYYEIIPTKYDEDFAGFML
ncbi:MAG: YciI family protein [Cloacibacillus sp.]